jgi:hypothetical protein
VLNAQAAPNAPAVLLNVPAAVNAPVDYAALFTAAVTAAVQIPAQVVGQFADAEPAECQVLRVVTDLFAAGSPALPAGTIDYAVTGSGEIMMRKALNAKDPAELMLSKVDKEQRWIAYKAMVTALPEGSGYKARYDAIAGPLQTVERGLREEILSTKYRADLMKTHGVLVTRLKALAIRIQYGYNAEKAYEESQLKGEAAEMHKYAKIGATKDRNDGTGRGRGRGQGKVPTPYVRPGSQPGGYGYYGGGYAAAPYTPAYTQAYAPAPSAPSTYRGGAGNTAAAATTRVPTADLLAAPEGR